MLNNYRYSGQGYPQSNFGRLSDDGSHASMDDLPVPFFDGFAHRISAISPSESASEARGVTVLGNTYKFSCSVQAPDMNNFYSRVYEYQPHMLFVVENKPPRYLTGYEQKVMQKSLRRSVKIVHKATR